MSHMNKRGQSQINKKHRFILGGAILLSILGGAFVLGFKYLPVLSQVNYDAGNALVLDNATSTKKIKEEPKEEVTHLKTPEPMKSIYMTSCVVGTKDFRAKLVKVVEETEINSLVIDIKDFSGTLSYKPTNPDLDHAWQASKCGTKDMKEFIATLHAKNIYVIGRVTVFQDPHYSKLHPELAVKSIATGLPWKDKKGLNFLDVGGKESWDYTIALAKDAYGIGFDEINFDYIRYPSDGNMKDASYTLSTGSKADQLEKFFQYLHEQLKDTGMKTSADLFGMTTTNYDDLNIGQVLERALPYFDYVAPMVYPSHYPPNFNGWKNPNLVPYELIHFVMKRGVERAEATTTYVSTLTNTRIGTSTPAKYTHTPVSKLKLRPWIQDFQYGGTYGPKEIRAQIQASYDVGLTSFMIWSPSNKYTVSALNP